MVVLRLYASYRGRKPIKRELNYISAFMKKEAKNRLIVGRIFCFAFFCISFCFIFSSFSQDTWQQRLIYIGIGLIFLLLGWYFVVSIHCDKNDLALWQKGYFLVYDGYVAKIESASEKIGCVNTQICSENTNDRMGLFSLSNVDIYLGCPCIVVSMVNERGVEIIDAFSQTEIDNYAHK